MVEGLGEMGPVEVSIDAEHLAEDGLAYVDEVLGKAGAFADPIGLTRVGELGEGRRGDAGVVRVGDARGVGGEDIGVVDLARDPSLHKSHVFSGGKFNGLSAAVEPGEGVVTVICQKVSEAVRFESDLRSSRHPRAS